MPDFEAVPLRGPRLSDLAQHVPDVLHLHLAEPDEFQAGAVVLSAYEFVPYALSGLAAARVPPATGTRPSTVVTIPLSDDVGGSDSVTRAVTLYGPGDVLRVDQAQIVRRYPSPGSTSAEETFHAHIEFDRPELPWALGADAPGERMLPWLVLVVLEAGEVEWHPPGAAVNQVMSVDAALLPDLADAWSTAHAQVAGGTAAVSARLSTAHAPANVSRLLGSRVLTQDTTYVACLVPATDAGVKAGLGLEPGTLDQAWRGTDGVVTLPVYDRWEFSTAPDGDFPRLARRLSGIPAPWRIGRRVMDTLRPGAPLADLTGDDAGRRQVLRCALFSPNPAPPGSPSDTATWGTAAVAALRTAIEAPAVLAGRSAQEPDVPDLPVVGPRVYAQGQRGSVTMPATTAASPAGDWFAELNLAPAHRVVAGLGTRVVVKDQEQLMQGAWAQVGEIDRANRELALAQLAQALASRLHARMEQIEPGRLLGFTRPLAARVRVAGAGLSVHGQTVRSATPPAALGGAFRRLVRPAGRIARLAADPAVVTDVVAPDGRARDFRRTYRAPDGLRGLSEGAIATLDPTVVAAVHRGTPEEAVETLRRYAVVTAEGPSVATVLRQPDAWGSPDLRFRPGAHLAERLAGRVEQQLTTELDRGDGEFDAVRSRWLGSVAAGLGQVPGASSQRSMLDLAVRTHDAMAPTVAAPTREPVTGPGRGAGPVRGPVGPLRRDGLDAFRTAAGRAVAADALAHRRTLEAATAVGRAVAWQPVEVEGRGSGGRATEQQRADSMLTAPAAALAGQVRSALAIDVGQVREALAAFADRDGVLALAGTPHRDPLQVDALALLSRLDARRTVVDAMRGRLAVHVAPGRAVSPWLVDGAIRPIMAAPRFDRAMYRALADYDREWLVPGLGRLPENEMVTVLEANDAFIEAFLVGLSDEMGRELLWRQYPTDQRGTYFHRFWDAQRDELRDPIHLFGRTRLGSHVVGGPQQQSGRAVVVVRGEVVRRYPDLTVMAMRAQARTPGGPLMDDEGRPFLPESDADPSVVARTLFVAPLEPDILMVGLDLTMDQLRRPGWWIVLSEHPQAPRFRRREPDLVGHEAAFAGADLATGAHVAADRLAHPARVAFEAELFLHDTQEV